MKLTLLTFIISFGCNLFYPEIISISKIKLDDIFFFSSVVLFFLVQISNFSRVGTKLSGVENYSYFVLYLLLLSMFFILLTIIQITNYNMPVSYSLDIIKPIKFFFPFILFYYLNESERLLFSKKCLFLIKTYLLATFFICIFQILFPRTIIFGFFATSVDQFQSLIQAPYGFIGNRTHAGFLGLLLFMVCLHYRFVLFSLIAFINILMHQNKMSIICSVLILLITFFYNENLKKSYKLFVGLPLITFVAFALFFIVWPVISNLIELGVNKVHTFSHRMGMIELMVEAYNIHGISFLLLGFPDKASWDQAFDSQYILLIFRFGIVITILYMLIPIILAKMKGRLSIMYIVFVFPPLTMINTYHYRLSLVCAVAILLLINRKSITQRKWCD